MLYTSVERYFYSPSVDFLLHKTLQVFIFNCPSMYMTVFYCTFSLILIYFTEKSFKMVDNKSQKFSYCVLALKVVSLV